MSGRAGAVQWAGVEQVGGEWLGGEWSLEAQWASAPSCPGVPSALSAQWNVSAGSTTATGCPSWVRSAAGTGRLGWPSGEPSGEPSGWIGRPRWGAVEDEDADEDADEDEDEYEDERKFVQASERTDNKRAETLRETRPSDTLWALAFAPTKPGPTKTRDARQRSRRQADGSTRLGVSCSRSDWCSCAARPQAPSGYVFVD